MDSLTAKMWEMERSLRVLGVGERRDPSVLRRYGISSMVIRINKKYIRSNDPGYVTKQEGDNLEGRKAEDNLGVVCCRCVGDNGCKLGTDGL